MLLKGHQTALYCAIFSYIKDFGMHRRINSPMNEGMEV